MDLLESADGLYTLTMGKNQSKNTEKMTEPPKDDKPSKRAAIQASSTTCRRSVRNIEDFEVVMHDISGDLIKNGPRVVSRPSEISEEAFDDFNFIRNAMYQQFAPRLNRLAAECREKGLFRFFSGLTKCLLPDEFSWRGILLVLFLILAILAIVGIVVWATGVIPTLWTVVAPFILAL